MREYTIFYRLAEGATDIFPGNLAPRHGWNYLLQDYKEALHPHNGTSDAWTQAVRRPRRPIVGPAGADSG